MYRTILCVTLALASTSALAAGTIQARLADGSYKIEDPFNEVEVEEAPGFEFRGQFDFSPNVFGRASYLSSESDGVEFNAQDIDGDLEFDTFRAGVGYQGGTGNARFYGVAEYASLGLSIDGENEDSDGVLISGGIKDNGQGAFLWNVELGLLRLDKSDGISLDFTLGWRINKTFALLFGGEGYGFDEDDVETDFTHVTLGAQLSF